MLLLLSCLTIITAERHFRTQSGLNPWVDVNTPENAQSIRNSRGQTWQLTFSDEFNALGRDFSPGKDHIWTSIEMADGVNAAMGWYSRNATTVKKERDGRGILQITTSEAKIDFKAFNAFARPPQYANHTMHYRSGMLQSWNKFCFQGGLIEVSAKMPAVLTSHNTDLKKNKRDRVKEPDYYFVWPAMWMMGNLGRALFTTSTNRMWPWSFDECDPKFASMQRISACDKKPGHGLHPSMGRGAPEIDIFEGGGNVATSSIQVSPGMPIKYRPIGDTLIGKSNCIYLRDCPESGANAVGFPAAAYASRKYKTWYQNLRYSFNANCNSDSSKKQSYSTVMSNLKEGVTDNFCKGTNTCPASLDAYADFGKKDNTSYHWGLNEVGGCMAKTNAYTGSFLCDPDNQNPSCVNARKDNQPASKVMAPFSYQMDAISASAVVPILTYTEYVKYQLEWTLGANGYIRWTYGGSSLFEIPAKSLTDPPQDSDNSNVRKAWIQEPMYLIMNVAVSSQWESMPPNRFGACRDGSASAKNICDGLPLYMKIDYIRLYQDTSKGSTMSTECDPVSHPTKQFISDHISDYETYENPAIVVAGGATCVKNGDCTAAAVGPSAMQTGECVKNRCSCMYPSAWGGPRCTLVIKSKTDFGPSFEAALGVGVVQALFLAWAAYKIIQSQLIKYAAKERGDGNYVLDDRMHPSPTAEGGKEGKLQ
uniref:Betaglucan synthesisassociated protein putative n=1 Tax=Albugo laibachii Nc14 TaxID=890382 RepID=F0WCU6_9STRA|nr:betaglucan synthesisassociated protein putative [Albugo laibachii Nc14]|eukprot:CCA19015.1 betaglucan synthesisassociated protein putative [Albugo laibachii Nc14]